MSDLEQPSRDSAVADTASDTSTELLDELDTGLETEQPAIEEVEEEIEGVKARGTKESLEKLKAERLMHADYTRKTQEAAEQRKAIEADRTRHEEEKKSQQAFLREHAQLAAVEDRLGQFAQVNWQALNQQDPVQAQALHIEFTQLQAMQGQLKGTLTQKQQQQQLAQQQEIAKLVQDGEAFLKREIKDWSPAKGSALLDYGKTLGVAPEKLSEFALHNPGIAIALDKAARFDQLVKQRTAKPPAAPAPEPVTRIGGASAGTTKKLSEMTDAEYSAARRQYKLKHR